MRTPGVYHPNGVRRTIETVLDAVIHLVSSIFVPLFLFGMAGSALVVVVTLTRDIHDFFSSDDEPGQPTDSL